MDEIAMRRCAKVFYRRDVFGFINFGTVPVVLGVLGHLQILKLNLF
jgi:hypothetical protein